MNKGFGDFAEACFPENYNLCGLPRFSVSRFILSSKSPNENSHIIQEIFDFPLAKDQAGGKKSPTMPEPSAQR